MLRPLAFLALASLAAPAAAQQVRLVDADTHLRYLRLIPDSADGVLQRLRQRSEIVFYDERVMPSTHQSNTPGGINGVLSSAQNTSANRTEPFGNANREFPWDVPAGTTRGDNSRTFKFWVPPDSGQRVVVWRQNGLVEWLFPTGTVFGEVLLVENPRTRKSYTFEVRTRTKTGDFAAGLPAWSVNAYRPFATADEFREALRSLSESEQLTAATGEYKRGPTRRLLTALAAPVLHPIAKRDRHDIYGGIAQGATPGMMRVADRAAFDRRGWQESIEPLDDATVERLLTRTPFTSVLGKEWRREPSPPGETAARTVIAPTTDADFHIVPRAYFGTLIPADKGSCQTCHESALKNASEFQPARDWYGRVRGNHDGIFSWNPWEPSNNYRGGPAPIRQALRPLLDVR